jgi:hypothetical protein
MSTVNTSISGKSEIVVVTKEPQQGISSVSFTIGIWEKVFYDCHYFSGEILEVQTDGLKVSIMIPHILCG